MNFTKTTYGFSNFQAPPHEEIPFVTLKAKILVNALSFQVSGLANVKWFITDR